jgi:DNA-directed RNA polymerase specialized sigma24 family protein
MASELPMSESSGLFPPTAWTFIRNAQKLSSKEYAAARNEFLSQYSSPVFRFLRAKRYPPDKAQELAQAFFVRFLEQDAFRKADQAKGRFRTFLLTVLSRCVSDLQNPERLSNQNVFERGQVPISMLITDEDRTFEPPIHESPEAVFMKRSAFEVMEKIRRQLKGWCESQSHPWWYDVFDAIHGESRPGVRVTAKAIAEWFDLTEHQVKYALEKTRQKFKELLKSEVGQHVTSEEEFAQEISDLVRMLRGEFHLEGTP